MLIQDTTTTDQIAPSAAMSSDPHPAILHPETGLPYPSQQGEPTAPHPHAPSDPDMIMDPATGKWFSVVPQETAASPSAGQSPQSQQPTQQPKPRRSMMKGGQAGTYDFSFVDSDGVTVFCRYAQNPEEIEQQQETYLEVTAETQRKALALQAIAQSSPDAPLDEFKRQGKEIRAASIAAEVHHAEFAQRVTSACVVGWENGSAPFSVVIRDHLSSEVAVEWMQAIASRSQLTQKDADFLASNSRGT